MAVSNGIPAASSDRKVIVSTKKAATTPMMSVTPMPAPLLVYMSPPSVTVNLAARGWLRRLLDLGDGVLREVGLRHVELDLGLGVLLVLADRADGA